MSDEIKLHPDNADLLHQLLLMTLGPYRNKVLTNLQLKRIEIIVYNLIYDYFDIGINDTYIYFDVTGRNNPELDSFIGCSFYFYYRTVPKEIFINLFFSGNKYNVTEFITYGQPYITG